LFPAIFRTKLFWGENRGEKALDVKLLNKIKHAGNRTRILKLYRLLRNEYRHFNVMRCYRKIGDDCAEYPSMFVFEPTNRCNQNCDICFKRNERSSRELTLEEIDKVFSNLGPSARHIYLSGGEVFLREDLFDILDLLKDKYKKDCSLLTNGTLIDEDVADRLSRYTNIQEIFISLDGPRDIHNQLRGSEDAFDKAVNAIRLLKDRLKIFPNCVVLKENVEYLPELVRIVHGLGVYNFRYTMAVISDRASMDATRKVLDMGEFKIVVKEEASNSYDFSYELLRSRLREARELGDKLGVSITIIPNFSEAYLGEFFHNTLFGHRKIACRALLCGRIDINGDVNPCAYLKVSFGSLLESSFEDIWNSDKVKLFRKKLLQDNLLPACRRCSTGLEII
jgi:MoaA/NifB/PqqE/SkfB family radical SAM enzyme